MSGDSHFPMKKTAILPLSVLAMLVFAAACGGGSPDFSSNFVGTYSGNYTVTLTSNITGQTGSGSYQTAFTIHEGASASDLVFGGSCGMTGHASSATSFITFQNTCTVHDSSSGCDFAYNLQSGSGTKNGAALTMTIPGTATVQCPTGTDSDTLMMSWNMIEL